MDLPSASQTWQAGESPKKMGKLFNITNWKDPAFLMEKLTNQITIHHINIAIEHSYWTWFTLC